MSWGVRAERLHHRGRTVPHYVEIRTGWEGPGCYRCQGEFLDDYIYKIFLWRRFRLDASTLQYFLTKILRKSKTFDLRINGYYTYIIKILMYIITRRNVLKIEMTRNCCQKKILSTFRLAAPGDFRLYISRVPRTPKWPKNSVREWR